MKTVDIGAVLDEGEWSGYQKLLVLGTALAIILDGLDNQVLGAAVPALMREWSLPRPAFASVLASGMLGMMGAEILPRYGWRTLFLVGGIVPLVLAAILWRVLPESPRYLARSRERWSELVGLLRRLGHDVPLDASFQDARETAVSQASIGQL